MYTLSAYLSQYLCLSLSLCLFLSIYTHTHTYIHTKYIHIYVSLYKCLDRSLSLHMYTHVETNICYTPAHTHIYCVYIKHFEGDISCSTGLLETNCLHFCFSLKMFVYCLCVCSIWNIKLIVFSFFPYSTIKKLFQFSGFILIVVPCK